MEMYSMIAYKKSSIFFKKAYTNNKVKQLDIMACCENNWFPTNYLATLFVVISQVSSGMF